MHALVRCTRGDDSLLFVRKGKSHKSFANAARDYFKKTIGSNVLPITGTIDGFEDVMASVLEINNSLCPGIVCPLYGNQKVYFRGPMNPLVCFIGEAPGEQEVKYGAPFVGPSGELLETLRFKAGFKDEECTFINILQCRPPENRDPTRIEAVCCAWRLLALLDRFHPKAVIMVGKVAATFFAPLYRLPKEKGALDVNILRTMDFGVVRLLHIRHPSYLLRKGGLNSKSNKKLVEDTLFTMKLLRELLVDRRRDAPKKLVWIWREHLPKIIRNELSMGRALSVGTDR